jgi:D-aminopeptidase
MPRLREYPSLAELLPAMLPPGPHNAITDVPGVAVGHFTLISGDGPWRPGQGPFRTGVTLVLPHTGNLYEEKVPAAVHRINGFGKPIGFEQVRELGNIETPIALTGTLNVPRVADALMTLAIEQNPYIGVGFAESGRRGYASVNPLVAETSDGFLSDLQGRPIGEAEVRAALAAAATGPVAEGVVGAGTGTSCYGWKGGIGTASRVLPRKSGGFTAGALVQTNFGRTEELVICGLPVGRHLRPPEGPPPGPGSIIIVLATDAPLDSRQLGRLSQRAAFGLARTGSTCHGSSGDFVITFSTAYRIPDRPAELLVQRPALANEQAIIGQLGLAVIEAVEEAIYNSLLMARTVVGRDGHTRYGLPGDEVAALAAGRPAQNFQPSS